MGLGLLGDRVVSPQSDLIAEMMAKGTYGWMKLATQDLQGTFDQVKASGAEVIREPTEQPYGMRDRALRDPSGNTVRIRQVD